MKEYTIKMIHPITKELTQATLYKPHTRTFKERERAERFAKELHEAWLEDREYFEKKPIEYIMHYEPKYVVVERDVTEWKVCKEV